MVLKIAYAAKRMTGMRKRMVLIISTKIRKNPVGSLQREELIIAKEYSETIT